MKPIRFNTIKEIHDYLKIKKPFSSKSVVDDHPSLQKVSITSMNYVFEHGNEKGYSLETLAYRRPKFLLKKVLVKLDGTNNRKYRLSTEIERRLVEVIKRTAFFKNHIQSHSIDVKTDEAHSDKVNPAVRNVRRTKVEKRELAKQLSNDAKNGSKRRKEIKEEPHTRPMLIYTPVGGKVKQ